MTEVLHRECHAAPTVSPETVSKAIDWLRSQHDLPQWWGRCELAVATAFGHRPYPTAIEHWWDLVAHGYAAPRDPHPSIGDLVFFEGSTGDRRTGHIAVMVGPREMLTTTSAGVVVAGFDPDSRCYLGRAPALWPMDVERCERSQ